MNVKKLLAISAVAGVIMAGAAAGPAFADSPHFVQASAATDGSGNLVVSFKEAGLGNNQLINYTASADATALFGCINKGGNHPQASNKESFSGPVTATGTFSSGKNGQVTASLTISPPGQGQLTCPDDMTVALLQVTYTNVAIGDTTNNVKASIPGTFTYTNKNVRF
jgi:hypothetical protein